MVKSGRMKTCAGRRTSLVVWWLRLCASTAGGVGSIPGPGAKILRASRHNQKKKKKICCAREGQRWQGARGSYHPSRKSHREKRRTKPDHSLGPSASEPGGPTLHAF